MRAISLTSAMLTARKVFSRSLIISALRAEVTGTILSIADPYRSEASVVQAGVMPPTTLGVFEVLNLGFPGSTRSGEKAR